MQAILVEHRNTNAPGYEIVVQLGEVSNDYAELCRKSLQSFLDLWSDLELEDG